MNLLYVLEKFELLEQIKRGLSYQCYWPQEKIEDLMPHFLTCKFTKHSTNAAYGFYWPLGSNKAVSLNHEISIHENLFKPDQKANFISTLLHEVAHLIAIRIYKKYGHCPMWKKIARAIGDDGGRTAYYEGVIDIKHNYTYTCLDCGYVYKTQRKLKNMTYRKHKGCQHKPNKGHFMEHSLKTGRKRNYLEIWRIADEVYQEERKRIQQEFYRQYGKVA